MDDLNIDKDVILNAVFETAADAIITIDSSGIIHAINPAAVEIFGYSEDELFGQNVSMLMPEPFASSHDAFIRNYLKTRQKKIIGIGREVIGKNKDGETLPIHLSVSEMIIEPETGETLFTGIIRDLRTIKRTEGELDTVRQEAKSYLDIAAVILLALDAENRITLVNRKGSELLCCEVEEAVGEKFSEAFVHPDDRHLYDQHISRLSGEGCVDSVFFECRVVCMRDKAERFIAWHVTALRNDSGDLIGTLSSGSDMTDYRKMMQQLVERESLARLGEMAAVVAHEVKNPIAGISGALKIIGAKFEAESSEKDILNEILARLSGLNEIVNDLLTFSKPQDPRLGVIPVQLLVEHCIAIFNQDPEFAEIKLEFQCDTEMHIRADQQLLANVISNVMINSAQAMGGEGKIEIHAVRKGFSCHISVRDNGPGVPEELRERLFEPFFTTKSRGTGLGLAIARRNVKKHGGDMTFAFPASGGTLVEIDLPLAPK